MNKGRYGVPNKEDGVSKHYPFALLLILLLVGPGLLSAQQAEAPEFFLIPDAGRVFIIAGAPPRGMASFSVARKGSVDTGFVLLNEGPVEPVHDPLEARSILGEDEYDWLCGVLKADSEFVVLRRLQAADGMGKFLSLTSLRVASVLGLLFVDSLVKTGSEYNYRITALDVVGAPLDTLEQKVLVQKHPQPEMKVSDLAAKPGKGQVQLEWRYPKYVKGSQDLVVGFKVYRRDGGSPDYRLLTGHGTLRTGEALSYVDREVTNDSAYEYCLTAFDIIGAESPRSKAVKVTPKDTSPPEPPTIVAEPLEGAMRISWQSPADSMRISGYNVYRSYSIHGEWTKLNAVPLARGVTFYVDSTAVGGTFYVYTMRALDRNGREGPRSTGGYGLPKDNTPPPPPLDLTCAVDKRIVRLTWRSQPVADLAGYHVYRSRGPGDIFKLTAAPVKKETPAYVDSGFGGKGLAPGAKLQYLVSQVDVSFNESERDTASVLVPDDEPPIAPSSLSCQVTNDGSVGVNWQPSLSSDAMNYRLWRQEEDKPAQMVRQFGLDTCSYEDKDLAKGKRYTYWVATVDSVGNESRTQTREVTARDIHAPPPPDGFQVLLTGKKVELSWQSVGDADLAGYYVYRSDIPGGIPERLSEKPAVVPRFTDTQGGEQYCYWVKAVDSSGNESRESKMLRPTKQ